MNGIGWAVKQLENGDKVRRSGWNGKGMWLRLIVPSEWQTKETGGPLEQCPWVAMATADRKFVPWLCSQTDLLAVDWEIAA